MKLAVAVIMAQQTLRSFCEEHGIQTLGGGSWFKAPDVCRVVPSSTPREIKEYTGLEIDGCYYLSMAGLEEYLQANARSPRALDCLPLVRERTRGHEQTLGREPPAPDEAAHRCYETYAKTLQVVQTKLLQDMESLMAAQKRLAEDMEALAAAQKQMQETLNVLAEGWAQLVRMKAALSQT
jgi:hypothetical protein